MKTDDAKVAERMRLIHLIRKIAREEVWKAIDDHLNDYEHKEKATEETDLE
jgi:hypothetical protein